MCLFHFSTCFEQPSAHHQESQSYQYIIWYTSLCAGGCLVCKSESSCMTCIPDGHLHRVIYRVSQEERTKLREGVSYVKLYRYNPKHLYPKLNGYGDNDQRKVWTSCISAYCTSTAVSRIDLDSAIE